MLKFLIFFVILSQVLAGKKAIVKLEGRGVLGSVIFTDNGQCVDIQGEIKGLTYGLHGFHIYEFGDLSNGCQSLGPHLNPDGKVHGGAQDIERHVGDFGNIVANRFGVAIINIRNCVISLMISGPYNILGKGVAVSEDFDDLGKGGFELSKTTGNSGQRIACGVIGERKY